MFQIENITLLVNPIFYHGIKSIIKSSIWSLWDSKLGENIIRGYLFQRPVFNIE